MEKAEFDFLLSDRIQKIQQIAKEYDLENKGYIAFSGGKDSTVLSFLVDLALPNNKIPRIYSNTGIDFMAIREFVRDMALNDRRFFILNPTQNLKKMFSEIGYPFKSKYHSHLLDIYSRQGKTGCVLKYAEPKANTPHSCPKILQFQFNEPLPFKMSDKCCYKMKKEPFKNYEKETGRIIGLTGMRRAEKGLRENINCLVFSRGSLHRFHPLAPCTDEFIDQLIDEYAIPLCRLYYSPFNFKRTGCKGCPYNIHLQEELDILEKFLPTEKENCEYLWREVYAEYRRIGYRLRKNEEKK